MKERYDDMNQRVNFKPGSSKGSAIKRDGEIKPQNKLMKSDKEIKHGK